MGGFWGVSVCNTVYQRMGGEELQPENPYINPQGILMLAILL